jgi:hypothetical protein
MPELASQCTPAPVSPPIPPNYLLTEPEQPPAVPPIIDPAAWEDFPVFRETFLLYVTDPAYNTALRIFGRLLHEMVLEYYRHWPNWLEGVTATELRAAVADLRHLEGYLGAVGREHEEASLTEPEMALSRLAARYSGGLARIADEIEQALGGIQ